MRTLFLQVSSKLCGTAMNVLDGSFRDSVYPASGRSELTLAFLLEQSHGKMSKAQVLGRYHCVVQPFTAADAAKINIPILIIESDNDPLVELVLRERLKTTYPTAKVHTLNNVGHFPYLNMPEAYSKMLEDFFK